MSIGDCISFAFWIVIDIPDDNKQLHRAREAVQESEESDKTI